MSADEASSASMSKPAKRTLAEADSESAAGGSSTKRTKIKYQDTITVLVGEDEAKFILHQAVVCETSDFFRAMFDGRGEWKESVQKTVRLPEVDESIFNIYLGFFYTGDIDLDMDVSANDTGAGTTEEEKKRKFDQVILAYAFGEMTQDATFRNALVDKAKELSALYRNFGEEDTIALLCEKVSSRSKLWRFFVDSWATANYNSSKRTFRDYTTKLPKDFVIELAIAGVEEKRVKYDDRDPRYREKCF